MITKLCVDLCCGGGGIYSHYVKNKKLSKLPVCLVWRRQDLRGLMPSYIFLLSIFSAGGVQMPSKTFFNGPHIF